MSIGISAYPIYTDGRPDFGNPKFGIEKAKKHPKYVHGKIGQACLMHKISYVQLHWYAPDGGGHRLVRLSSPHRVIAVTHCGNSFFLQTAGRAAVCDLPKPDALLCAKCHGTGKNNFGDGGINIGEKQTAKVTLGCVAKGVTA